MLGCNRFQRYHRFRRWFIAGCLTKTTVRHNPRQPKSQCSTFHPPFNPIPNRSRFISQLLTYCNHSRRNSQLWQTQQGRPTLLCIRPDHFISIQNGALALLDHERNHLFSSVFICFHLFIAWWASTTPPLPKTNRTDLNHPSNTWTQFAFTLTSTTKSYFISHMFYKSMIWKIQRYKSIS